MNKLLSTQEMYDSLSPEEQSEVDRLGREWSHDLWKNYVATLGKEQQLTCARTAQPSISEKNCAATLGKEQQQGAASPFDCDLPGEVLARALGFGGAVSC